MKGIQNVNRKFLTLLRMNIFYIREIKHNCYFFLSRDLKFITFIYIYIFNSHKMKYFILNKKSTKKQNIFFFFWKFYILKTCYYFDAKKNRRKYIF